MPGKTYPTDVIEQTRSVLDAWRQIKEDLTLGDLTLSMLAGQLAQAEPGEAAIVNLENQLTEARNQRDALYTAMWDKVKRVRSAVKGIYGDDSSQYELVGGTRKSDRKTPVRKPKPTA
jgi:hypothetical protein